MAEDSGTLANNGSNTVGKTRGQFTSSETDSSLGERVRRARLQEIESGKQRPQKSWRIGLSPRLHTNEAVNDPRT